MDTRFQNLERKTSWLVFNISFTLHKDEWTVVVNGKHSAPYATQKEAFRAAVDAAHADGKAGHDAQVLVQRENHQFRIEWTYGQDPYSPD
ncbi:DUF2188 domain-containing protein [Bradyrhizobium liaoningense]|uniref:DUF2188 domain-containing protein n=1 Tax=Bradyrhizobium liaoningense TaxID=43992 RepID=UPI001FCC37A5|nr:DUF2188 domain-containing protein [Bradyrhizobium liaoningense]